MFDIQGGSIMDSNAFMPKPKKPLPFQTQAYSKQNLRKIKPSNLTQPIRTASTLFREFQKIHSPKYQLQKTERKLQELNDKRKVMNLRKILAEKQKELNEAKKAESIKRFEERKEVVMDIKHRIWGGYRKAPEENRKKSIYD